MVYLALLAGLVLLVAGGDVMVRGAVSLAQRLNMPKILVGLTIVSLGTSAPEMTVVVNAALKGSQGIAAGTVVGSNIANILLILGAATLITPVRTSIRIVRRDAMVLVVVSALLAGLALSGMIGRLWGLAMLAGFAVYVAWTYYAEKPDAPVQTAPAGAVDELEDFGGIPPRVRYALPALAAGCAAVVFGADMLVDAAVEIARRAGIAEEVIGLSLVAVGTSLPELSVSIIAAWKGEPDVALGNAIGSNISNILVIMGTAAVLIPVPLTGQIASFDVWVMLATAVLLVPVLASGLILSRCEGVLFLSLYGLYVAGLYLGLPAAVISALGLS